MQSITKFLSSWKYQILTKKLWKNISFYNTSSITRLSSDDESEDENVYDVRKALERLVTVAEADTVYDISKSFTDEIEMEAGSETSESESVESI